MATYSASSVTVDTPTAVLPTRTATILLGIPSDTGNLPAKATGQIWPRGNW